MRSVIAIMAVTCFGEATADGPKEPRAVKIVFDTDMDSDCDDLGALALLHILADRGEVQILATVSCSKQKLRQRYGRNHRFGSTRRSEVRPYRVPRWRARNGQFTGIDIADIRYMTDRRHPLRKTANAERVGYSGGNASI